MASVVVKHAVFKNFYILCFIRKIRANSDVGKKISTGPLSLVYLVFSN
jgi:hypothetical protein